MSGYRLWSLAALSLTIGVCAPPTALADVHQAPPARQQAKVPTETLADLYGRLSAQYKAQDEPGILATLRAIESHPDFKVLPGENQWRIYASLAFSLLYQAKDYAGAYEAALKAATYSEAKLDADYWFLRSDTAALLNKYDESIDAFIVVARSFPSEVSNSQPEYVSGRVRRARELKDDGAKYRQLLEALYEGGYAQGPNRSVEYLWFDLFEVYVKAGETELARALSNGFTDADSLIQIAMDKRYSGFRTVREADITAAYETELKRYRALTTNNPRLLEGPLRVAETLNALNRGAEGLRMLDEVLARIDAAPKEAPAFDDLDDYHNWALNERSWLLERLGRYDESEQAMLKARDVALAANDDVVSQKINLGGFYYTQSKPERALQEVADVDPKRASIYGQMSAEEVRACAYAQMGDKVRLKTSLDLMLKNAKEAFAPLRSALLCAGDLDTLAKVVIARLDDPDTRTSVLFSLQTYWPEPNPTPFARTMDTRQAELTARPDVTTAVAKYGYILNIPTLRMPH